MNDIDHITLRTNVILSVNRALLGSVTTHLRGVTVAYSKEAFTLRAYFDNGATYDDKEFINVAVTEIEADMHKEIKLFHYEPIDLSYPEKMQVLMDWIFLRYEEYQQY